MERNNITLIGMPGSGKSTVGVLLAKSLGYRFLDADLLIQQREGALLQKILEQRGVEIWTVPAPSLPPAAAQFAGREAPAG